MNKLLLSAKMPGPDPVEQQKIFNNEFIFTCVSLWSDWVKLVIIEEVQKLPREQRAAALLPRDRPDVGLDLSQRIGGEDVQDAPGWGTQGNIGDGPHERAWSWLTPGTAPNDRKVSKQEYLDLSEQAVVHAWRTASRKSPTSRAHCGALLVDSLRL